jgi:hypothetical protein
MSRNGGACLSAPGSAAPARAGVPTGWSVMARPANAVRYSRRYRSTSVRRVAGLSPGPAYAASSTSVNETKPSASTSRRYSRSSRW